jgi:phosphoribosylformylglycinamidine cyclo-ligase
MKARMNYKTSGVDIGKANIFVDSIQPWIKKTMTPSALVRKGSFGGLFELGTRDYRNPVLVSSTDGVGTKLLVAKAANKHDTVGIDLVAMNVNDILCVGAKPLFFLDYIACGTIQLKILKDVVKGIAQGCRQAGCVLIGGETAEMPGMYKKDDYDLAGFAVGVVEKDKIIDGAAIEEGDRIIGLASSGLHSNGFSLARKVFSLAEQKRLADELLKPTRIYVKEILNVLKEFPVHGIAHMTGGAFYEKLTRIIPDGKCAVVDKQSWPVPEIFRKIRQKGQVDDSEMYRTFNMGIGLTLVVNPRYAAGICSLLERQGVPTHEIGKVVGKQRNKIKLV